MLHTYWYGCFLKWWYHQIIHFNRVFLCKPSILGYHYFRKHPYLFIWSTPPKTNISWSPVTMMMTWNMFWNQESVLPKKPSISSIYNPGILPVGHGRPKVYWQNILFIPYNLSELLRSYSQPLTCYEYPVFLMFFATCCFYDPSACLEQLSFRKSPQPWTKRHHASPLNLPWNEFRSSGSALQK